MQPPSDDPSARPLAEVRWHFGDFVVWERRRRLERLGAAVRLGPRSFDLLLELVRRAGEFLSKDELLSTVWAGVVVEEGSVRVHMSTLRKALGEPAATDECQEWITNVPLRGYRFNGRVRRDEVDASTQQYARRSPPSFAKPPERLTTLVGRDADVAAVLASLNEHRLVTLVGTGGVGKTSIAIRIAELKQSRDSSEVAFVDLAPLISPEHVLGTVARSVGAAADLPEVVQGIARCLEGRDVLMLIDNCERVLDSLAAPITSLLEVLPDLRILATSREPLRATGEFVFRLEALAVPQNEFASLTEATRSSAVRLLIERSRAAGAGPYQEEHGALLTKIARQLDGIPLAIELVASRLGVQPVADLALRLDDHIRLHSTGNRTAATRHHSLAAAIEWSVAMLTQDESRLFRWLSIFRGPFDAESALRIAVELDPDAAFDALISLVRKSLVHFDGNDANAPYRLLDTTRSYAAALLQERGEHASLGRRHAVLMLDTMNAATSELKDISERSWKERYAHRLDDVRVALDVVLIQQPDPVTGPALVSASTLLWFHLSQVAEYREKVAIALELVERQPEQDTEAMTSLSIALVTALLHTGRAGDDLSSVCDRAIAGAIAIEARPLELRARWARCTVDMFRGEYAAALTQAKKLLKFADAWTDPSALILSNRVAAMANHFCGKFDRSHRHSKAAIAIASAGVGRAQTSMVGPDAVVATKAVLCRTLWIQGETANALEVATDAVERAAATGHAVSLCAALYGACPVALWSEELELAREWVDLMRNESQRWGLVGWLRYAEWFLEGLRVASEPRASHFVRDVRDRFPGYDAPHKEMAVTFCLDWVDDGMAARVTGGEGMWSAPEVWRAIGWRHERRGALDDAQTFYRRAIDDARRHGAIAWEIRAVLSLSRAWVSVGEEKRALKLLSDACSAAPRTSEGAAVARVRRLRDDLARH